MYFQISDSKNVAKAYRMSPDSLVTDILTTAAAGDGMLTPGLACTRISM